MATRNVTPPDFGSCWSCTDDITIPSTTVTGFRVVGEAIVRRWQTPVGSLIYDPNYGFDISDYVGDDIGDDDLQNIAASCKAQAEQDERVLSCDVNVTLTADQDLIVTGKVTTAQGPFSLVVSVDQVTVTLLQVK